MSKELILKIKDLEEKIRFLEFENSDWTDRAEDIYLFATTSETISKLTDVKLIFEAVLENISIIKNISYCAIGIINDEKLIIDHEYALFCECESVAEIYLNKNIINKLSENKIISLNYLNNDSNYEFKFCSHGFSPKSFMIFPFSNIEPKSKVLICVGDNGIDKLEYSRQSIIHTIAILNSRLENIYLIQKLAEQNDVLEHKVKERTDEYLKAKLDAERSDHLKSEFLAQMSHEIRTPINTMLNFFTLIEESLENKIDPELRDSFNTIHSASRRITRTIDLILNMSEIQTGTYESIPKEINLLDDILLNLEKEFSRSAKKNGVCLRLNTLTNECNVVGDEYSILQIFSNLIDNAVKYTHKGDININLFRDKKNKLVVEISDTGIGIDEKYLSQIFEPFTQETQGYTRNFEGNGLGLALVKKYCEINNFDITVESKKGVGSSFRVIF